MIKKLQSTESRSNAQGKTADRKNLIVGSIVATLIAITPYIFYSYESVPDTRIWNTFLFTFDSKYYESAMLFAWTLMNKILPVILLFIWFFTCRHWWYHALIVPIAMYFYQMNIILNDDLQYVDARQLEYLIPIMAIVIPSIYLVRAKMFNNLNSNKSLEEFEEEFTLKPKNILERFKDYF